MALLRLVFLLSILAPAVRAVEIRFVPAIPEGTVSLGIYDEAGRMVRLLCDEWPVTRFSAGLNGLSTEWDGRDTGGQPVPSGLYRGRGFVIGDVRVEGEAIHFNDWLVSDEAPRIASVGALAFLPDGAFLLAARLSGDMGSLLRYAPLATAPWRSLASEKIAEGAAPVQIAIAAGRAFVLHGGKLRAVDLAGGAEVALPPLDVIPEGISAQGEYIAVSGADRLLVYRASDFTPLGEIRGPDIAVASAALLGEKSAVVADRDGSLWHGGEKWERIETPAGSKTRAVAAGRDGTFWTIEENGSSAMVVQYSADEGRLAEWSTAASGRPASLSAAPDEDAFAVVFASPAAERTVVIRRNTGTGWELVFDKTITASSAFGLQDGRLSPSAGELPAEITVPLAENPLDPGASRQLVLRAAVFDGGTGLVTTDGLPLVRVSGEEGFTRLMLQPGTSPGTARFYQGDGACVEEYSLTGLADMAAFDAGTIEMEGGAEKAPPPGEDQPEPSP